MSNIPITSLPIVITLDGSEVVPLVQGGTTKRTTTGAIAGLANTTPGGLGSFVTATDQHLIFPNSRRLAAQSGVMVLTDAGAGSTLTVAIATNGIGNAQIRQGGALSVIGNSTNALANVADISASLDGQILRRSGAALGFGALNLASANAITGSLPVANETAAGSTTQLQYNNGGLFAGITGATTDGTTVTLASPILTGVPVAPTAAPGTATTQIATTAFAQNISTALQNALNGKINLVARKLFTASGTYTPTTGMVQALIECIGPGGGGGGAAGTVAQTFAGGGGGAGEYASHLATAVEIGTSLSIITPAGGAGGVGAVAGSDGAGSTTATSLVSAAPGRGGKFGASSATAAVTGGLGGTGGTSDYASPGAPGAPGFLNSASTSVLMPSGNGGSSRGGGGAIGVSSASGATNGVAGAGYGGGGSGGFAINTASTATGGAGAGGACIITEFCAQNLIPSLAQPIVFQRTGTNTFIVNAPIINGAQGEYVTWTFTNVGQALSPPVNMLALYGISTNENGVTRVQTDGAIAGAVFEYAMNIGRTDNAFGTYQFAGNGHGNITDSSPSISMDGGSNIFTIPVGNYVRGTTLTIAQTPGILLPPTATPNGTPGSAWGTINQGHIIDSTGIGLSWSTNVTQTNAGDQNSYTPMLPLTGMNRAQFGVNTPLTINTHPGSPVQSANQGLITSVTTWNTARPDLKVILSLPNGVPTLPDGWAADTTSNTFNVDNPTFSKIYMNYRSGNSAIAATNQSHLSHYAVTK